MDAQGGHNFGQDRINGQGGHGAGVTPMGGWVKTHPTSDAAFDWVVNGFWEVPLVS